MNSENQIVIASEAGITIHSFEDITDAIGACFGAGGLLLTEVDVTPDFFNLRTGLAGELFQKCTNYAVRLALVVPDPIAYGERFSELAHEHRTHRLIRFFPSEAEAHAWLSS